ncbi:MAG: hypothetical protein PHV34_03000 [Verrucomicrobiae bacterium]|nr:hypothetical protein [Verrucomicrobiae bacterium]
MKKTNPIVLKIVCFLFALLLLPRPFTGMAQQTTPDRDIFDLATVKSDYRDNLCVYLHNSTSNPIQIKEVFINGNNVALLNKAGCKVPIKKEKSGVVIWHDVCPNPLPPGDSGVVKVRIGDKGGIKDKVCVKLIAENGGTYEKELPVITDVPMQFDSYCFNPELNRLFIQMKGCNEPGPEKIFINNQDHTAKTLVTRTQAKDGEHFSMEIRLSSAVEEGKYLVVKIEGKNGPRACLIKTMKPFFPISMYALENHWPKISGQEPILVPDWFKDCAEHSINSFHLDFIWVQNGAKNAELFTQQYKMKPIFDPGWGKELRPAIEKFRDQLPLLAWMVADEPEMYWEKGLNPMSTLKRTQEFRKFGPRFPTCLVHCPWPGSPSEYNLTDVIMLDDYPIADAPLLSRIKRSFQEARQASLPKPIWFAVQAFRQLPSYHRFPTDEEERLMIYQAIAEGAKGVLYFCYSADTADKCNGLRHPDSGNLWNEIRNINRELTELAPYLLNGAVVPLAETKTPKLEVSSLLCGREAIVLVLLNNDFAYDKKSFQSHALKDVQIDLSVPNWFDPRELREISSDHPQKIAFKMENQKIHLNLDTVKNARVFLLSGKPSD